MTDGETAADNETEIAAVSVALAAAVIESVLVALEVARAASDDVADFTVVSVKVGFADSETVGVLLGQSVAAPLEENDAVSLGEPVIAADDDEERVTEGLPVGNAEFDGDSDTLGEDDIDEELLTEKLLLPVCEAASVRDLVTRGDDVRAAESDRVAVSVKDGVRVVIEDRDCDVVGEPVPFTTGDVVPSADVLRDGKAEGVLDVDTDGDLDTKADADGRLVTVSVTDSERVPVMHGDVESDAELQRDTVSDRDEHGDIVVDPSGVGETRDDAVRVIIDAVGVPLLRALTERLVVIESVADIERHADRVPVTTDDGE